jgi:hypothetical protein
MRDHPYQNEVMLAGMWGGVANILPPLEKMLDEGFFQIGGGRCTDQVFLRDFVWPMIVEDCLVHDSCYSFGNAQDFPPYGRLPRPSHVGAAVKNMPPWQPSESKPPAAGPDTLGKQAQSADTMGPQFDAISRLWAKKLFFIAATEKSGTTWMQLMLNAHPEIVCRGEGQLTTILVPEIERAFNAYSERIGELNSKVFGEVEGFPEPEQDHRIFVHRSIATLLLAAYGDHPDIRAVGEKTPGNIRTLGYLKYMFPQAKMLLMWRDGRDIAVSGWLHLKRQWGEKAGDETLANYSRRLAKVWRGDIEKAREFAAKNPGTCHWVRYEDLHADPSGQMKQALDFLGLDASAAIVETCVKAGDFKQLSKGRDRGDEDKGSHFRKGIVGDWRNYFDDEAAKTFDEEAGSLLRELGYTK